MSFKRGHQCPRRDCPNFVGPTKFACGRHWRLMPNDLKREIQTAWREEPLGPAHIGAMHDAVTWLNHPDNAEVTRPPFREANIPG